MLNDKIFVVVSFCTFAIMITKGWFEGKREHFQRKLQLRWIVLDGDSDLGSHFERFVSFSSGS